MPAPWYAVAQALRVDVVDGGRGRHDDERRCQAGNGGEYCSLHAFPLGLEIRLCLALSGSPGLQTSGYFDANMT